METGDESTSNQQCRGVLVTETVSQVVINMKVNISKADKSFQQHIHCPPLVSLLSDAHVCLLESHASDIQGSSVVKMSINQNVGLRVRNYFPEKFVTWKLRS